MATISKTAEKTPIFAYLRRSTNKLEQAESLIQQEDGINSLVKKLGLEKENIRYFAETFSGFENKKRKQWTEMVKEIDKLKQPCIILTRDISRLSRNPTDSQGIMDRLYGDNKNKRKIEKIYSLDYDNVKEWNKATDKEEVHRALSASYYDSLDTRRKSIGGILIKLEDGQFPYAAPKGTDNHKVGIRRILRQNEKMPFIRRAFEMKTEGKTHKEISKYLMQFAQIRLSDRELSDRLFNNEVYIGEYTEKTTGKHFSALSFAEGKPPIERVLWDKVQKCIGRKISQYGEKQDGHIFEAKMKSESGHLFSKYLAKKKYPAYKGKFKDIKGNEQYIHISEINILGSFIKIIGDILSSFSSDFLNAYKGDISVASVGFIGEEKNGKANIDMSEIFQKYTEESRKTGKKMMPQEGLDVFADALDNYVSLLGLMSAGREFYGKQIGGYDAFIASAISEAKKKGILKTMKEEYFTRKLLVDKGIEIFRKEGKDYSFNENDGYDPIGTLDRKYRTIQQQISRDICIKMISEVLKKKFDTSTKDFKDVKVNQLKRLEKQKEEIETERKDYRRNAIKMGYSKEEIDETSKDMDNQIKTIDFQISELSDDTDMDIYLERLPEILLKTVELASNAISKAMIEELKEDVKTLLEISTVELTVTNKKELKVKLFDVLDKLVSSDIFKLEAPSGVEPLYKALQASA